MSRRRRAGLVQIRRVEGKLEDDVEIRQVFLGEGWEVLTDALIEELVKKGWAREDLVQSKALGFFYCRPRNSIVSRPEAVGF